MPGRVEIGVFLEGEQAVAEAAVIDQKLDNIGKAGQSGANQAKAGLSGLEKAAVTTKDSIARYDREILGARADLAQLSQQLVDAKAKFGSNSEQVNALKQKMVETSVATRGLVAEKALLVAESKAEEAATNATTSAFSRKTTMINTGQGALKGYDAALTGVIRSMGGINLGLAVGISLAASFIPLILSLIKAKEEQIKIDKDQIATDLQRVNAGERNVRVASDMTAAFRILGAEKDKYQKTTKELTDRLGVLERQGFATQVMVGQGGETYTRVVKTAQDLQREVIGLNADLGKQEEVLGPAIETIKRHQEATHQTTEDTLKWAVATHKIAAEDLPFMREQLARAIPELDEFQKKLNELSAPRFDLSGTLPGTEFLRASVESTFQLARENGIQDWAEQVRFATPALKALDEAIKHHAGNLANYRRELAQLEPGERAAIELMKQQEKVFKDSFSDKEQRDAGLALEKEFIAARAQLMKQDFDERAKLIQREFELRREELQKTGQATQANLSFLKAIELTHLTALINERVKAMEEEKRLRNKEADGWFQWLLQLENLRRQSIAKSRQAREEEERKVIADMDRIERERKLKSGRDSRLIQEIEDEKKRNSERERAVAIFGRLAHSEQLLAQQVALANGELSDQEAILVALGSAAEQFTQDWIKSGQIFQFVADGISDSLRRMVANGEDFGKNMKAVFLDLIAQLASYWGRLFISMGAGMLFIHPAAGIGLIVAGTALMALAGVFAGLADRARSAAAASGNSAAAAAGSSGGGGSAGGGSQREGPGQIISFPTSGAQGNQTIVVKLDRSASKDFLNGHEVVMMSDFRGGQKSPEIRKRISKWSKASMAS